MTQFQHISIEQAHARLQNGELVVADIRDARSFAMGHIKGAFNLNNDNAAAFVGQQDKQQSVILVACYHGVSSQSAAQYLCTQGFEQVYSLDGGMTAWASQYPTELERS